MLEHAYFDENVPLERYQQQCNVLLGKFQEQVRAAVEPA
jgi:hypothetical protein